MRKHIEWSNGAYAFDNIDGAAFYVFGGDRVVTPEELAKVTGRGVSVFAIREAAESNATLDQIEDGIRHGLKLYGVPDRIRWDRTRESMKAWRGNWPKIANTIAAALADPNEFA